MDRSGDVTVGRVIKPHGIRGEVVVDVLSDVPGRFDVGVVVGTADGPRTIAASRPHQGRVLVRFEGVETRNDAELLRGLELTGAPADVSDSETFFAHELVGLAVRLDADRSDLGTVSALIELPDAAGYDLLEVTRPDGRTWLLPAVDELVEAVEGDDGALYLAVIDPPEGLLDDGGAIDAGPVEA